MSTRNCVTQYRAEIRTVAVAYVANRSALQSFVESLLPFANEAEDKAARRRITQDIRSDVEILEGKLNARERNVFAVTLSNAWNIVAKGYASNRNLVARRSSKRPARRAAISDTLKARVASLQDAFERAGFSVSISWKAAK